ncbi:Hypoxia up-regulated protein 1 [Balamuthia mandrillaris]
MRTKHMSSSTVLLLAFGMIVCLGPFLVRGQVLGLDFGSQWIKMSVIRANNFEIILDPMSRRKISNSVAFNDGDRYFGADAERMVLRNPSQTYSYTSQLLGRKFDHAAVKEIEHFLPYRSNLEQDPERGIYRIRYDPEVAFTAPELVAMILSNAVATAESYLGVRPRELVITVPPFFTQEERLALLEAADIAGLRVLSLINDGTALALHYAFGKKFEEEVPHDVVFYDMGHSYTRATLVEFRSLVERKGKKNSTIPILKVKAVAWDQNLGGRDFDHRFAQHMAHLATEQLRQRPQLPFENIAENARAMVRIQAATEKAKLVLSTNQETTFSVEGLLPDFDFRTTITRDKFEELCQDLFDRVADPVRRVLAEANMTADQLQGLEIVGGGVRVPKVQTVLKDAFGREDVDRHLNGDEAAVLGAVFFGAQLSVTMRVPEYRVKDDNSYTISGLLSIPTHHSAENTPAEQEEKAEQLLAELGDDDDEVGERPSGDDDGMDEKYLTLFKRHSRIGAKKSLSFHTNTADNFTIAVQYNDTTELPLGTEPALALYTISGIEQSRKHNYTGKPKISVAFRLNLNGLLELETAEMEYTVVRYPPPTPEVIPSEEEKKEESRKEADAAKEEANENQQEPQEGEGETTKTEKTEEEQQKEREEQERKQKEEEERRQKEEEERKKPKKYVHRFPLKAETAKQGIPALSTKQIHAARDILAAWDHKDFVKRDTGEAKNDLETFIYGTKERLYDDDIQEASTEEQREVINEALSDAADWLDGDGDGATAQEYRAKQRGLEATLQPILYRVSELVDRPEAISALHAAIETTRASMVNITEMLNVEEEEQQKVLAECVEIEQWLKEKMEEQEKLQKWEDPVLRSEEVKLRTESLLKNARRLLIRSKRKPKVEETIPAAEEGDEKKNEEQQQEEGRGEGEEERKEEAEEKVDINEEEDFEEPAFDFEDIQKDIPTN